MGSPRRFCRFAPGPADPARGRFEVPPDGLCLSAFVLVHEADTPTRVLLGRVNPHADWAQLGALDPERLAACTDRWMLPSSHLIQLESPTDAAQRIVREMTPLSLGALDGPRVISDVYASARRPGSGQHWDLGFLFRGTAAERALREHPAWTELKFVETRDLTAAAMARSHEDILAYAGVPVRP